LAHAGVLDVLDEEGIPIDYIAGCSSGAIIAASYACGTLRNLKRELVDTLSRKELFSMLGPSENTSGFFTLDKARERLKRYVQGNLEDVKPQLAFVTVDVETGEQIAISMGDMLNAIIASCSLPGLFETIKWGNRNLVDGGLLNIVPSDVVRTMGADIVIAVDIAASRYVFAESTLKIIEWLIRFIKFTDFPYSVGKRIVNWLKAFLIKGNYFQFYSQSDFIDESEKLPSIIHVMAKVIEISRWRQQHVIPFESLSDFILEPKVKHFERTDFSLMRQSYLEGRRAAKAAVPQIVKMIEDIKLGKRVPLPGNYTRDTLMGDLNSGFQKL